VYTVFLIILWPLPQHFSGGVFEPWGFSVWIFAAFAWGIIGGIIIVVLPILDFVREKEEPVAPAAAAKEEPEQASA
jgi:hypothetical protein